MDVATVIDGKCIFGDVSCWLLSLILWDSSAEFPSEIKLFDSESKSKLTEVEGISSIIATLLEGKIFPTSLV